MGNNAFYLIIKTLHKIREKNKGGTNKTQVLQLRRS
jgi:hypothetical protein